jgi:UDP-glucose 4-epimerase
MYEGRHVLVTGGLGFIGSNLAIRLVELGAHVTIVDSSVPGCGANLFNIEPIKDRVEVIPKDIADASHFQAELRWSDVIFNIAGEISHTESMRCPERDLNINTLAQLRFLLACRTARPGIRIVFASTRQVYGSPRSLPVTENHSPDPVDFNGIHKLAATEYHLMLSRLGELDALVLRLSNVYGPRMALKLPHQGFLSTFLRLAAAGKPVTVYGEGSSLRDPVYVDDAVEAFLRAGAAVSHKSRVYNVGGPEALPVSEIAALTAAAAGAPPVVHIPFPAARKAIDIGSYVGSFQRIRRELGWQPRTHFRDGIERTLAYYAEHGNAYSEPAASESSFEPLTARQRAAEL